MRPETGGASGAGSVTLSERLMTLMTTVQDLLRARADQMNLDDATIDSIRPRALVEPAHLPALSLLPAMADDGAPITQPVIDALLAAAPVLAWRQTYDAEDGFDQRYLDTYGWIDLAGPTGPYQADGVRVMAGYWGQGLAYPDHAHPPDEHYLMLAGSCWLRLDRDPFVKCGPGDVFHTPSGRVHSAEMRDAPLLAISVWRADDLSVRIDLGGRSVVKD